MFEIYWYLFREFFNLKLSSPWQLLTEPICAWKHSELSTFEFLLHFLGNKLDTKRTTVQMLHVFFFKCFPLRLFSLFRRFTRSNTDRQQCKRCFAIELSNIKTCTLITVGYTLYLKPLRHCFYWRKRMNLSLLYVVSVSKVISYGPQSYITNK
jgi:hypothetical protein